MSRPKVYITRDIPAAGLDLIRPHCDVEIWPGDLPPSYEVIRDKVQNCVGLLSLLTDTIDEPLLRSASQLKVVSNFAVGYNNIDIPAATKLGIKIGHTPGVLTEATADCAFALLISAARRVVECDAFSRSGHWKTWEPKGHIGQDLLGKTLGIFGLGRIGHALARRCHLGWRMPVIYCNRRENEWSERARVEWNAQPVSFETLLAESDFLSIHASLNADSKGVFNLSAFEKMKPTAVLINTARGGLCVQADLVTALSERLIFSAGLDVTDPEPPRADDPLLKLKNVVITPHFASATIETRDRVSVIAAENLLAGVFGRPLPHCVNP